MSHMSSRARDENTLHHSHSRKPLMGLKAKGPPNENAVIPGRLSVTRPTLTSSLKAKPELRPKSSRPVLAALAKPNANATTRPATKSGSDAKPEPKVPLADKSAGLKRQPKIVTTTQTPGPKRSAAKSAKKAISVYTPARPQANTPLGDDAEVEFSYPIPPAIEEPLEFGKEDSDPHLGGIDLEEHPGIPAPLEISQSLSELSTGDVDTPPRTRPTVGGDLTFSLEQYDAIYEQDDLPVQPQP